MEITALLLLYIKSSNGRGMSCHLWVEMTTCWNVSRMVELEVIVVWICGTPSVHGPVEEVGRIIHINPGPVNGHLLVVALHDLVPVLDGFRVCEVRPHGGASGPHFAHEGLVT